MSQSAVNLTEWGWNEAFAAERAEYPEGIVGRILSQREDVFSLVIQDGMTTATAAGALFHKHDKEALPAVGDWVLTQQAADDGNVVTAVLPRRTRFLREAPGGRGIPQIVASNVDVVFLVTPVLDVNRNRLERFLVGVCGCGAEPVVVLTKSDLASEEQRAEALEKIDEVMDGLKVLYTTTPWSHGRETREIFSTVLRPAATHALVGASGAGKSTLLNSLVGESVQQTGEVREGDGKGRHVTSFRQLFALPDGSLVMDTPGMRELAPWSDEGGIAMVFSDIVALAEGCRFRSCEHQNEPDCAVQQAVEQGRLSERRLVNWRTLRSEISQSEERREIMKERREREYFQRQKKRDGRFSGGRSGGRKPGKFLLPP